MGDLAWHACLEDRLFRPAAARPIARELELVGAKPTGEPHEDARRLYSLYKEDKVSEDAIVRAMTVCYAGWTEAEVTALAKKLAGKVLSKARYEGIVEIARGLAERGLRVVVVSGSPKWFVREGVRGVLPLDPEQDVFGTSVVLERGVLGADMIQPITFFEGKVKQLELALPGKRPSFAFGDFEGRRPAPAPRRSPRVRREPASPAAQARPRARTLLRLRAAANRVRRPRASARHRSGDRIVMVQLEGGPWATGIGSLPFAPMVDAFQSSQELVGRFLKEIPFQFELPRAFPDDALYPSPVRRCARVG